MYADWRSASGPSGGPGDGCHRECQWRLRRNCALSPRQSAGAIGALIGLVAATAVFFGIFLQLWLVLPFAALCAAAVASSFVCYARHATDGETVTLDSLTLVIEADDGAMHRVYRMRPGWLRVIVDSGHGTDVSVYLCESNQRVEIGREISAASRLEFATQLRRELARGLLS
ncbi:DUF2244 domain-containing protein [Paraburkholderia diazotrophica]|uniref:Uncharacterized membrane protein n=1 Tax=Paraburkholderia diazotrophica TaxID=667676 RepID=A0A1H6YRV0_9BURK|nr:DUF2244 domain-containing protein [Paraburkholderia diazotrophica]SEJ40040.1 Uncharacterized membrane protein [Paraburkholderia diazotrophica]